MLIGSISNLKTKSSFGKSNNTKISYVSPLLIDYAVETTQKAPKKSGFLHNLRNVLLLGTALSSGALVTNCSMTGITGVDSDTITIPLSAVEQKFVDTTGPLKPIIEYIPEKVSNSRTMVAPNYHGLKGYSKVENQIAEDNTVLSNTKDTVTFNSESTDLNSNLTSNPDKITLSISNKSSKVHYDSGLEYTLTNLGDGTVKQITNQGTVRILKPVEGTPGTIQAYDTAGNILKNEKITKFIIKLTKYIISK